MLNLTLPWPDEDFEAGIPRQPAFLTSHSGNGGIYCELIRAMRLWSDAHSFIRVSESSVTSRMTILNELDARISEWWTNIPEKFALSTDFIRRTPSSIFSRLLLIHIVYHKCLCALHSSIVLLFSWSEGDPNLSYARQVSAQIAFDHATIMSDLFEACLLHFSDWPKILSFIGYAAYCASAIQIPFMWCSKGDVRETAYTHVRTNLKMIHTQGKYWKYIALLGLHVRYLYEMHAKNPVLLDDKPKFLHPDTLKGFRVTASRARTSILSHNDILWNKGATYAEQGGEIIDLSVQDTDALQLVSEASISPPSLPMAEVDSAIESAEFSEPTSLDYFQPFIDSEIFNSESPLLGFEQIGTPQYTDQFDMWLGGWSAARQAPAVVAS